jgi:hypothetical protein
MGFIKKIGETALKVVKKVTDFVKAPLDMITKPFKDLVSKVCDMIPFGLGNLIKPFANQFLDTAAGCLAGGPMGGFLAMLGKMQPAAQAISGAVDCVDGAMKGGLGSLPKMPLDNLRSAFAYTQSKTLF